ncbi:MAG: PqqD family protein [Solirubrobacteraceae bacterium]
MIEQVADEVVAYDLQTKEAHCLKAVAAFVFSNADGRTTVAEITARAEKGLATPTTEAEIIDAVQQLEQIGLLTSPLIVRNGNGLAVEDDDGLSRRQMMRRMGIAGAVTVGATPLITSIVAPTAAMALSGIPTGCTGCGKNNDCLSTHCCQSNPGKQCHQSCCVGKDNSCHISGCTCTGGTTPGATCVAGGSCPGGGQCLCNCTVCLSDCSVVTCPPGSSKCCTQGC